MPGHRNHDCRGSLLDRLFFRFEKDRMLLTIFTILATILALVSLFTSVVLWLTIYTLPSAYPLEALAGQICTAGYILLPVCLILTLFFALWRHSPFRLGGGVLLNLMIMWFTFTALLLARGGVMESMQLDTMMGTLFSVVIALFGGFFLAVLPSVLIACVAGITHMILDLILPK